jgi:demethylmenaquinone methyltransferase/2-methoxy-6-polyprenyl-1,4-benzoquinol methylase
MLGAMSQDTEQARRFYDRIAGVYDALSDRSEHEARERGLALLDVRPGMRVLEIGYGTGHGLQMLAGAVGASGHVDGIDVSEAMRDEALERLRGAGLAERVAARVGAVPPLPWPEASFDRVGMSFTLELFPPDDLARVLAEAQRVLRPEGLVGSVSMAIPDDSRHESLLEKAYVWMHRHFPHIVDCRPIDAPRLFEEAGLDVVARAELEIWTLPVVALVGAPPRRAG